MEQECYSKYIQEAYISVSPNFNWTGSEYVDYTTFEICDVADVFHEQDELGITRSFEMYDKLQLIYSWKKVIIR